MFISPALEELTEDNTSMSGQKAVPSSIHDPPSVEDSAADSPSTDGRATRSQDIESFQQELSRQLTSVDPQKYQQVKQAIQSAVQNYGDSADLQSVIQDAKRRVQQVLTGSGSGTDEEAKGAFTTVAEAVMSAGTAIGQFSSQMLGGGELQTGSEASLRAEEASEPLKRWWQSKQSSAPTDYFTSQEQDIPGGHARHTEEAHQSSGPGGSNSSSAQHNSETSSWSNSNDDTSQGKQLQQQQRQLGGPADNFSRSSHSQSEINTLEGDAQRVGLEEARRRARGIY